MNLRIDLKPHQQLALLSDKESHLKDLIEVYPPELYNKLIANKEKLSNIALYMGDSVSAISTAVLWMKCEPEKCPYKTSCILNKNKIAPQGYACPIEKKITLELTSSLKDELEIDDQSVIEMELLYDLIDAKLLDMRTSGLLSEGGIIQIIKVDTGKSVTTSKDISPEFKIKMDLKKLKHVIMEDFVATRRSKKRFGLGSGDTSLDRIIKEAINKNKDQ